MQTARQAAAEDKVIEMAAQREAARLKAEPFKTLVSEMQDETRDQLRGWNPPRGAYILLEKRRLHLRPDTSIVPGYGLQTIWVEDRPDQAEKLRAAVRKGCRILHYANFPKLNDPDPARAAKARMHGGPDHRNPWDTLEREVRQIMGLDNSGKLAELEREKQALEAKLAEALKAKKPDGK